MANIDSNTQCSYVSCLLGACVPIPIILISSKLDVFLTYSSLCSVVVANWYGTQPRQLSHRTQSVATTQGTCRAWLCLTVAHLLMTVMLMSALYHNCSVRTRDGVEIPLRDSIHNIIVSPAWAEFRHTVKHLFHCLIHDGLHKFVHELRIVLDPEGENSAYRVRTYCQCYIHCVYGCPN